MATDTCKQSEHIRATQCKHIYIYIYIPRELRSAATLKVDSHFVSELMLASKCCNVTLPRIYLHSGCGRASLPRIYSHSEGGGQQRFLVDFSVNFLPVGTPGASRAPLGDQVMSQSDF